MKKKYSFKGGQRGKFYHPRVTIEIPVYLDQEVVSYLSMRAIKKKVALDDLVNDLLRKEIASLQAAE
jgi:hypothetical protein